MADKDVVRAASRLEDVIPALLNVSLNGANGSREPVIRCPLHEDSRPSLRVNLEKQVWHCDPCGVGGDVFELVQKVRQVDFPTAVQWLAARAGVTDAQDTKQRTIAAVYDYRDENGELLYQVVRFLPKDFRQRRPNGEGWMWNMQGVRRVLYRLDKLKGREAVVIVEGERDADTLWSNGLPATTNSGGAGKWLPEYGQQLQAAGIRRVVVIPDNDAPGREHAHAVAKSCQGVGLLVRLLELPDVGAKGDTTDFLASRGKDAFVALLKSAPEYREPVAPPPTREVPAAKAAKAAPAGQSIDFGDVEPWPTPVDGAALLADLRALLQRFVILDEKAADGVVLWITHTYLMAVWRISPFLVANSPTKQCGKTRLLEIVAALVYRPLPTSSTTPAALFRVIEKYGPTLLFDEAENWITDKQSELRGILNAGHTRRTAIVIRTVGDRHEVVCFSTWAPKFIALIGALADTMTDRSIVVPMRRKRPQERVDVMLAHQLDADVVPLRRRLVRFADDHADALSAVVPQDVPGLRDRAVDNWGALFAIADAAGGDWPARAREAAVTLSGGAEARDDTPGLQLLEDCYAIWRDLDSPADVITSAELIKHLNEDLPESQWGDARGGKGVTASWLSRQLRTFGVVGAGNVRHQGKQRKGYRWASFADAWARYAVSEPSHRPNANKDGPKSTDPIRPSPPSGTDAKTTIPPMNPGLWDGGTVSEADTAAEQEWGDV